MAENQNMFEEFRKIFYALREAEEIAKHANSEDAGQRMMARNYALAFAYKNIPGLEAAINDPIAREQIPAHTIDMYLATAKEQYGKETYEMLKKSGKDIIKDSPDKGLAEIVLGFEPYEIKENEKRDEIAKTHLRFYEFNGVLLAYQEDSKKAHPIIWRVAAKYAKDEIKKRLANNPALKDKNDVIERLNAVVLATLAASERAASVYAEHMKQQAEKEFKQITKNDENRAKYARKILNYWLEKGENSRVAEYLGRIQTKK